MLFLILAILMIAFMQEVYQTQSNMNQLDSDRIHENVLITSAYIGSAGQLFLNVTNQGSVTAKLVRLWIINQTDNQHFYFDFSDLYVAPGAAISNVTSAAFTLGKNYAVRVVTERGNIASYNLVPAVQARISIIASSTNTIGNNVTVIMCITNNDTSGNNIYNLIPQLTVSPNDSLIRKEGPTPPSIDLLPSGSSAYFMYVYKVTGSGLTISLNGTFTRAPQGNYATTTIYATSIEVAVAVTSMPLFHLDAVGSIPALLDPASSAYTYWGVALANPYNRSITVFSVGVVTTSSPIFQPGTLIGVNPTTGWSSTSTSGYSGVFWESATAGTPITIPALSAYNFTFRIKVAAPSGGVVETPVNVEAITTEGKFIKSFTTSVENTYPAMNLYYTTTPTSPTNARTYVHLGIPPSIQQTYNVTAWNSGSNALTSSINLLILVPVGWSNVNASSQTGWNYTSQTITQLTDGSWLISVTSNSTSLSAGGNLVYQFNATTPSVAATTLYTIATTAYYPQFTPSITSAFCSLVVQIKP